MLFCSFDDSERGFTILLLAEADEKNKVFELLDKAALLVTNHMKIRRFLLWKPVISKDQKNFTNRTQVITILIIPEIIIALDII